MTPVRAPARQARRRPPAHATHRHGDRPRPRQLGAVAALALASIAAALLWPSPTSSSVAELSTARLPDTLAPPEGPVTLTAVSAPVVWSDVTPPAVTAELRNSTDAPVAARAWWLLAAAEDAEPWERATGRGTPVTVTLAAGGTARVAIPAAGAVMPGSWRLSVWVHTVGLGPDGEPDGSTAHSHGSGAIPAVNVLATGDDVRRLGSPGRDVALTGIEPAGRLAGGPADGPEARVSVRSTSAQPVFVEVQCYLAAPGTAEPWEVAGTVPSHTVTATVESGPRDVACEFEDLPGSGTWELSAFARLAGRDDARAHQDGLYLRRPVDLGGSEPAEEADGGSPDGRGDRGRRLVDVLLAPSDRRLDVESPAGAARAGELDLELLGDGPHEPVDARRRS